MKSFILAIGECNTRTGALSRSREITVSAPDSGSAANAVKPQLEPGEFIARVVTPEGLKANRYERRRAEYFANLNTETK